MLIFAIAFITAALVFYTMGVWAEHKKKVLTWPHVILFGLGLVCDATGTEFMRRIAQSDSFSFGGKAVLACGVGYLAGPLLHRNGWRNAVAERSHLQLDPGSKPTFLATERIPKPKSNGTQTQRVRKVVRVLV